MALEVDGLKFEFPAGWSASKFDEWSYYRNQFIRMRDAIQAVDVLAVDGATTWLIEVKDFRVNGRPNADQLHNDMIGKVLGTLAALPAARVCANDHAERALADASLRTGSIKVLLHLEQPPHRSALRTDYIDPVNLSLKLRGRLKAVDPHPRVVSKSQMAGLAWNVN